MKPIQIEIWCIALVSLGATASGQSFHSRPYEAQLRTDPAVGNVQGVQRFGRTLRTDPDRGDGFSYHVYPVAHPPVVTAAPQADPALLLARQFAVTQPQPGEASAPGDEPVNQLPEGQVPGGALDSQGARPPSPGAVFGRELQAQAAERIIAQTALAQTAHGGYGGGFAPFEPFDATRGLRNYQTPRSAPSVLTDPMAYRAALTAQAFGFEVGAEDLIDLYQQPLIQVKLRVVEVVRADGLQANSVLEYVSRENTKPSLTSGKPLNNENDQGFENLRGLTRFAIEGLVSGADSGSGALVNLTSEHINWVLSFLSSELNADVVTAPEVVTLNGQNVEFISGAKIPFRIGQNVIQGTNNNIQQFFFKNVGAYVSVTPKIVNWGFYGEGGGEADISSSEITDWNGLAALLLDDSKFANDRNTDPPAADLVDELKKYAYNQRAIPYQLRSKMLKELNKYQRSDLFGYPVQIGNEIMFEGCVDGIREVLSVDVIEDCNACNWKPENCTIDMSLVVRLSDANSMRVTLDDTPDAISVNFEDNVRAIANTIQIRSGEGVVMAGLIGDRELDQQNKVPILGDLPYVGFLFRSKEVLRQKTEVLIFLEAQVLDPVAPIARAQSSADFMLSQDYVDGPLLDNALEVGINRVGIGSYLPPARKHECIYWERHGRKIQKMATHVDDIIVK